MPDPIVDTWNRIQCDVTEAGRLLARELGAADWLATSLRCVDLLESLGHALEVQLFASATGRSGDPGTEALRALTAVRRGWEPSSLATHVAPRTDGLQQALARLEVARMEANRLVVAAKLSAHQIRGVVVPTADALATTLAQVATGFRGARWEGRAVYLERRAADLRSVSHKVTTLITRAAATDGSHGAMTAPPDHVMRNAETRESVRMSMNAHPNRDRRSYRSW